VRPFVHPRKLSEMQVTKDIPLKMIRADLENIPDFGVPADYTLRWYQHGDEAHWLEIHLKADRHNAITLELFGQQFGTDEALLARRQCYLLDAGGVPIGTATAWFNVDFEGGRIGQVHWVALMPEYQGRGLSKPLMTAVCRRLRELGHDRAYLTTAAARRRAIHLYLGFGFVPLIGNKAEEGVWREILGAEC